MAAAYQLLRNSFNQDASRARKRIAALAVSNGRARGAAASSTVAAPALRETAIAGPCGDAAIPTIPPEVEATARAVGVGGVAPFGTAPAGPGAVPPVTAQPTLPGGIDEGLVNGGMGKGLAGMGGAAALGSEGGEAAAFANAPMELDRDIAAAAATSEDTASNGNGAAYVGMEVDDAACELPADWRAKELVLRQESWYKPWGPELEPLVSKAMHARVGMIQIAGTNTKCCSLIAQSTLIVCHTA